MYKIQDLKIVIYPMFPCEEMRSSFHYTVQENKEMINFSAVSWHFSARVSQNLTF